MARSRRTTSRPTAIQSALNVTSGRYGTMEVLDAQTVVPIGGDQTAIEQLCRWRPDTTVLPGLAASTVVHFRLRSMPDGSRRYVPCAPREDYSWSAVRIGMEILAHHRGINVHTREDYLMLLQLVQRMPTTQAHFKRQFSSVTDLYVKRSGRGGELSQSNILPENLGRGPNGRGRKWSISRLLEAGQRAYEAIQQEEPEAVPAEVSRNSRGELSRPQAIAYGLMAAAELDPLELAGDEVRRLVRMTLLDLGSQRPANHEDMIAWVTARLFAAWNAHVPDSDARFNAWFQGGRSNLIKTLANLAGHCGGRLTREDVDWALLERTAQGLWYAADCQNAFAQAVRQTIQPPLAGSDRETFEHWYQPQPYLGGLTLPLIWQRSQLFRPILERIWLQPADTRLHRVLWRMMEFFFQMVSARRLADRQAKSRTRRTIHPFADPSSEDDRRLEIPADWIELLAARSGCVCRSARCPVEYDVGPESDSLVIYGLCARHGSLQLGRLALAEARQILDPENQA